MNPKFNPYLPFKFLIFIIQWLHVCVQQTITFRNKYTYRIHIYIYIYIYIYIVYFDEQKVPIGVTKHFKHFLVMVTAFAKSLYINDSQNDHVHLYHIFAYHIASGLFSQGANFSRMLHFWP